MNNNFIVNNTLTSHDDKLSYTTIRLNKLKRAVQDIRYDLFSPNGVISPGNIQTSLINTDHIIINKNATVGYEITSDTPDTSVVSKAYVDAQVSSGTDPTVTLHLQNPILSLKCDGNVEFYNSLNVTNTINTDVINITGNGKIYNTPLSDNDIINKGYVQTQRQEILTAASDDATSKAEAAKNAAITAANDNITTAINNISTISLTSGTITTYPASTYDIANKKYVDDNKFNPADQLHLTYTSGDTLIADGNINSKSININNKASLNENGTLSIVSGEVSVIEANEKSIVSKQYVDDKKINRNIPLTINNKINSNTVNILGNTIKSKQIPVTYNNIFQMCVDPDDNIYFIHTDGHIKRILYGTSDFDSFELNVGDNSYAICSDSAGNIYVGGKYRYIKRILYGTSEWDSKELIANGIINYFCSDSFVNIYVTYLNDNTIRRIIPGKMTWDDDNFKFTIDGNLGGICIDVYNNIYISSIINSNTTYIKKILYNSSNNTYSWDSSFNISHNTHIYKLCSDSIGNIYVGDTYGYIKRIPYNSSSFDSLNLDAGGATITGLCVDHNDNVYIGIYSRRKILRILHGTDTLDSLNMVYGNTGKEISGINIDSDNNIYVYGEDNYILKLSSTGCSITYDSTTHTLKFTDENDPSYTSSIILTQT